MLKALILSLLLPMAAIASGTGDGSSYANAMERTIFWNNYWKIHMKMKIWNEVGADGQTLEMHGETLLVETEDTSWNLKEYLILGFCFVNYSSTRYYC